MNRKSLHISAFSLGHSVEILTSTGDYNTEDGSNSVSMVEKSGQLGDGGEFAVKNVIATGENTVCCKLIPRGFNLMDHRKIGEWTCDANGIYVYCMPRSLGRVINTAKREQNESTVEVRTRDNRVNNI